MNRFNRPVVRLLAAGVMVAAAVITLQARQQATVGTGLLAGRVVDAVSGSGVGAAVVTLSIVPAAAPAGAAPAPPIPVAQTRRAVAVANSDGRFVFRDLPPGSYTITSTFEGFAPGASGRRRPGGPSRPIVVAEGARQSDLVISMWRLSSISGVVRDDRGEPVVGVAVNVMRRVLNGGRYELTYDRGGITDDRGHYRAFGLLPGAYVVTIGTATHTAAVSMVDAYQAAVTAGTTGPMRQVFSETWALYVSPAGLVVNDWQLSVSSASAQPLTRPDGTVLIQPRVLYPNATNVPDAEVLMIGSGVDRTGVDLTMPLVPGMRVSGVLSTPVGPAANHGMRLVLAVRADGDLTLETPVAYCTTDPAGRFAFLGIPPGSYLIRAHRVPRTGPMPPAPPAAGAAPVYTEPPPPPAPVHSHFAEVPVTVGSSNVDGVSVTLQPGARLSGRLAFEGATAPPPAARVQQVSVAIVPLSGREASEVTAPPVRTGAEGRFTSNGYAPGRYLVGNVTPPGPEWTLASIRIGGTEAAGQTFTIGDRDIDDVVVMFTDKVIALSGEVRPPDASGSPDATVVLFPADFQAWLASGMSPRRLVTSVTSAGGSYQLRVPLPGDYLLVALPPEIAPDVDADFVKRFSGAAVRVTLASGDTKMQPLTVARVR